MYLIILLEVSRGLVPLQGEDVPGHPLGVVLNLEPLRAGQDGAPV